MPDEPHSNRFSAFHNEGFSAFFHVYSSCQEMGLNLGIKAFMLEEALIQNHYVNDIERAFLNYYQWLMDFAISRDFDPNFIGTQLMPRPAKSEALTNYLNSLIQHESADKRNK